MNTRVEPNLKDILHFANRNDYDKMWKGMNIQLYNEKNTASTRWLTKISQMLIDDEWPSEQKITFEKETKIKILKEPKR